MLYYFQVDIKMTWLYIYTYVYVYIYIYIYILFRILFHYRLL